MFLKIHECVSGALVHIVQSHWPILSHIFFRICITSLHVQQNWEISQLCYVLTSQLWKYVWPFSYCWGQTWTRFSSLYCLIHLTCLHEQANLCLSHDLMICMLHNRALEMLDPMLCFIWIPLGVTKGQLMVWSRAVEAQYTVDSVFCSVVLI